jgi:hypothetical protein
MRKITLLSGIAAGLLLFAPGHLRADVPITVKLTIAVENPGNPFFSRNKTVNRTDTIKVTTQGILSLLEEAYGVTFPKGSTLWIYQSNESAGTEDGEDADEYFQVRDANDDIILDTGDDFFLEPLSFDFAFFAVDSDEVSSSTETDKSFKINGSFVKHIIFRDGNEGFNTTAFIDVGDGLGTNFELFGLVNFSEKDRSNGKFRERAGFNGIGSGTILDFFGIWQGRFGGTEKGTVD